MPRLACVEGDGAGCIPCQASVGEDGVGGNGASCCILRLGCVEGEGIECIEGSHGADCIGACVWVSCLAFVFEISS
jgi:hypothetical protein